MTRQPADRAVAAEWTSRAFRRATGAEYSLVSPDDPATPLGYVPGAAQWADITPTREAWYTFGMTGADIVAMTRPDGTGFPVISPAPDTTALVRDRAYRVVAPVWSLWTLAKVRRYNPIDVASVDIPWRTIDAYCRKEWGVAGGTPVTAK